MPESRADCKLCLPHVGFDLAPYGIDPVFKLGTTLYNADLDNEEDTVQYYNCSLLSYKPTYDVPNGVSSGCGEPATPVVCPAGPCARWVSLRILLCQHASRHVLKGGCT